MTPLQAAKAHCANYQTDGSCLGMYYKDDLSVDWQRFAPRSRCLLADCERCPYFEEIILPMRPEQPAVAKSLSKAPDAYRRLHKLQGGRFCPRCGESPILARQRVCVVCRVKARRETHRKHNSSRQRQIGGLENDS